MGVLDNGRVWTCTVTVYDLVFGNPAHNDSIEAGSPTTYTNTNIKSWKITDTMSANGDVAFGSTGSKALNLELIGLSSKAFGTGAIITVALGGAATKTWAFFVDTVAWNTEYGTTTRYSASVTAYDAMYYANGKIQGVLKYSRISPSIKQKIESGSASVTDCKTIAQYCIRHARYDLIRTRAAELYSETQQESYNTYANMLDSTADEGYSGGKTMDNVCDDDTGKVTIGTYSGYSGNLSISGTLTARTLLGRMAAMAGKRAYCNNYSIYNVGTIDFGNLITGTYTTVTTSDVYENGFVSEGKKKFTYFTTGKEDYGKKTSNGFSTMSINCPDMTSSKLASVASPYRNVEYEIGSVKFRGDPNLSSGMRLTAPDASGATHNMVCTKIVTCYDGGLYQQLYSEGKSDSDIEFENNSYAENAEQIVDEGGGSGGGSSYQFYTETTFPNSATINVDGNSITADTSHIGITGDTDITGSVDITSRLSVDGNAVVDGNLTVNGSINLGNIITGSITSNEPTLGLAENAQLQLGSQAWGVAFPKNSSGTTVDFTLDFTSGDLSYSGNIYADFVEIGELIDDGQGNITPYGQLTVYGATILSGVVADALSTSYISGKTTDTKLVIGQANPNTKDLDIKGNNINVTSSTFVVTGQPTFDVGNAYSLIVDGGGGLQLKDGTDVAWFIPAYNGFTVFKGGHGVKFRWDTQTITWY